MVGWLKSGKWKKQTRRSVFVTLLISYILILLIPVGISSVIFGRMSSAMVDQANRSNTGLLEQAKQAIDQRLTELDQFSTQVALNTKLLSLLSNGPETQRNESLVNSDIIKDLGRLKATSSFIDEMYVYVPRSNSILTGSMRTDLESYFTWFQLGKEPNYPEKMKQFLSQPHYKEYMLPAGTSSDNKRVISYVQSLPIEERETVRGALVIQFQESKLLQVLKQIEWVNRGDIVILDTKGHEIMSTTPDRPEWAELGERLTKEGESLEMPLGGERMMVTYTTSGVNGWKYVSVVPRATVMQGVETARTTAWIALLVSLVAGAAACWYMANRNYNPIRQLLNTVFEGKPAASDTSNAGTNEYELIRHALVSTLTEERELRKKLFTQLPVMQMNFIARLLKGQVDSQSLNSESLSFMNVEFVSDQFAVILIDIDDCSRFVKADTEQEWALVRFTLANLSQELPFGRCFPVELERERMALLFNAAAGPDGDSPTPEEQLAQIASLLKDMAASTFRLQLSLGLSTVREGLHTIKSAYDEAVLALEYKVIKGAGSMTAYGEIADLQQNYYHYPLETEAQIMNFAKSGDIASIERLLDELFERHFAENRISVQMGKCLFIDMLGTPLKLLGTLYASDPHNAQRQAERVEAILSRPTAEEMLEGTKLWYRQICETAKSERSDHSERLHQHITRYVEQHYGESFFSLTHLADELGLTPQYLSSFFKKHTGQNLSDYVTAVRVQKAKELLSSSTLTITQIAHAIGYANDVGLIRVFKKSEGITPGKYRENLGYAHAESEHAGATSSE
ncbi:helix-turn-helix domain-containing protein [Paenibacillus sp. HJGM_3]|uniref:helix-turn-helix domain-containing protein n=1 Tax=Paenibacillus sp. HJGM_3 TaxID=3379816 RepID=UPI00385C181E